MLKVQSATDIFKYGEYVFGYPPAAHHREMVEFSLEGLRTRTNSIQLWPRGGAKTTWDNTILGTYLVATRPDIRIGLFSKSAEHAFAMSRGIRLTLERNEQFREVFGHLVGDVKWTDAQWLTNKSKWAGSHYATMFANGVGGQIVSKRFDVIICHEKGTQVFADGQWMAVENHPTAQSRIADGLQVSVWGLPFPETVTSEHRYWAMDVYDEGETQRWVEAERLTRTDAIGYPIDMTVEPVRGIPQRMNHLHSAGKSGIVNDWHYQDVQQPELNDPDWWWALGLWWGDGHRARRTIGWTISDRAISRRLTHVLDRYGYKWHRVEREGCWQITVQSTRWAEWLTSWRTGNSMKQPPAWVEKIEFGLQAALMAGYIDADGWHDQRQHEVRITSVHLPGLLAARRILARLGVAASIRKGPAGGTMTIRGRTHIARQRFDLRFHDRHGSMFGLPEVEPTRWAHARNRTFIANGYLWSKIRGVVEVENREFVPIKTETGAYLTAFGQSHNCDDILDEENTSTVEQRERVNSWFWKTLYPCLAADGVMLVIGTRWAEDDLYQTLLDAKPKGKGWRSLVRGALVEGNDGHLHSYWPEVWPVSRLLEMRESMGSALFSCAYMNDIQGLLAGEIFRREWFQYFESLPEGEYTWRMGVDLAMSTRERADYTARVVIAEDRKGNFYVFSAYRDKMEAGHAEFVNSGYLAYPQVSMIKVEAVQAQSLLVQELMRDYPRLPVTPKKTDTDKTTRARAVAARYEAHKVWHHISLKGGEFEAEEVSFPKSHDDMVDALGFAMDLGGSDFSFGFVKTDKVASGPKPVDPKALSEAVKRQEGDLVKNAMQGALNAHFGRWG